MGHARQGIGGGQHPLSGVHAPRDAVGARRLDAGEGDGHRRRRGAFGGGGAVVREFVLARSGRLGGARLQGRRRRFYYRFFFFFFNTLRGAAVGWLTSSLFLLVNI